MGVDHTHRGDRSVALVIEGMMCEQGRQCPLGHPDVAFDTRDTSVYGALMLLEELGR